jgi:hypothetical protein
MTERRVELSLPSVRAPHAFESCPTPYVASLQTNALVGSSLRAIFLHLLVTNFEPLAVVLEPSLQMQHGFLVKTFRCWFGFIHLSGLGYMTNTKYRILWYVFHSGWALNQVHWEVDVVSLEG